jgi:penicillin-binding protein 1A
MTWREIMAFAHAGLDLKPIPGVSPPPVDPRARPAAPAVARAPTPESAERLEQLRMGHLSRRTFDVIQQVDGLFRAVQPARAVDVSQVGERPAEPRPGEGFRAPALSAQPGRITEIR